MSCPDAMIQRAASIVQVLSSFLYLPARERERGEEGIMEKAAASNFLRGPRFRRIAPANIKKYYLEIHDVKKKVFKKKHQMVLFVL